MNHPGLSCVLAQGLLLSAGIRNGESILPSCVLAYHQDIRATAAVVNISHTDLKVAPLTLGHSIILGFYSNADMPFTGGAFPNITSPTDFSAEGTHFDRVAMCSIIRISTTTHHRHIEQHSITSGFFLSFSDHLIPALPFHQHQLYGPRAVVRCMQTCVFVYHRPRSNGYACTDVGERSLIGHDSPVASPFAHMNGDRVSL